MVSILPVPVTIFITAGIWLIWKRQRTIRFWVGLSNISFFSRRAHGSKRHYLDWRKFVSRLCSMVHNCLFKYTVLFFPSILFERSFLVLPFTNLTSGKVRSGASIVGVVTSSKTLGYAKNFHVSPSRAIWKTKLWKSFPMAPLTTVWIIDNTLVSGLDFFACPTSLKSRTTPSSTKA